MCVDECVIRAKLCYMHLFYKLNIKHQVHPNLTNYILFKTCPAWHPYFMLIASLIVVLLYFLHATLLSTLIVKIPERYLGQGLSLLVLLTFWGR